MKLHDYQPCVQAKTKATDYVLYTKIYFLPPPLVFARKLLHALSLFLYALGINN